MTVVAPLPLLSAHLDTPDASLVLPPEPPPQVGSCPTQIEGHSCRELAHGHILMAKDGSRAEWLPCNQREHLVP